MRYRSRSPFAYAVAVVLLTTAGCAMITGASDLTVVVDGGARADGEGTISEGGSPSLGPDDGAAPPDVVSNVDAEPPDAGPDAPPAIVRCDDASCTGKCCIVESSGTCAPPGEACPALAVELSCDERADCPTGSVCCLTIGAGGARARCSATCPVGANLTLCRAKVDCPAPLSCEAVPDLEIGPSHGFGACQ